MDHTDTMQCPGCHQLVDVERPAGTPLIITHRAALGGEATVSIRAGHTQLHLCSGTTDDNSS